MRFCATVALAVVAVALSSGARAEEAGESEAGAIIVTGHRDGYRQIESTSGTKTSIPLLDVPQSIAVVTAEQIGDQQIRSIADLVRYIPGTSSGQGEGHRDQVTFRGNNSTADFFVDGLRDDIQYFRSFYNIDRVEVHKGPNAMIFGRGGGGGLLNRVTKGPLSGTTMIGGSASADTFGSFYGAADVNVPLNGIAAARLNAFYEELDNHRDAYQGHRYGINPVAGAEFAPGVRAELGYEYVRDKRVVDRGIPSAFAGTISNPAGPLRGFRDTFFGVRGVNNTDFEGHMVRFRGEAALTDTLKLTAQALYGDYDKSYRNVFAATAVGAPGPGLVGIEAYQDITKRESLIAQTNLIWDVKTGGIGHTILVGAEYTDQDTYSERVNGFFDPLGATRRVSTVLADPPAIPPVFFIAGPAGAGNRAVDSRLKQVSVYAQDQIALSNRLDLIVGLRYDRFDLDIANRFVSQQVGRVDDLWSPRAGLVFKPVPEMSFYLSYSKSFLPQSGDQFLSLDATTANLKPETFDNYEVGAKWDIRPDLQATIAVYRLDRGNTRATGPTPGTVVLTGIQRSHGAEFGLTGRIVPEWQIALGYAYTEAEIHRTTTSAPAGRQIAQVPRHQLSLWNRYDVTDRLGLGLGFYHQSKSFTSISNVTRLPAYSRLDAAVFFKLNDTIQAQVNVENLTNTKYFPVAHNDNNISTGAPINARFTINARF